jgi:predicted ABC-type transport system involved in lysophospholipase L1 biosynthesis ATPase subunit
MTTLELSQVRSGPILMADTRLGSGLTVVTGEGRSALSRLVELSAGVERPRQGRVLLDGADPHGNPALRKGIAALVGTERLPLARTVLAATERVLTARGDERRAAAVLDDAGLGAWSGRRPGDLDATETRAVALALALAHRRARLLALTDPFRVGSGIAADFVRDALRRHAGGPAIVLVTLTDPEPLRAFSAQRLELRGGLLGSARPGLGLFLGSVALQTRTADPQRLVKALADVPEATGVRWDERAAPGVVVVFGSDLEALGTALSHAATSAGIAIEAIVPATLPVPRPTPFSAPPQNYGGWAGAPQGPAAGLPPLAQARAPDQSVGMPNAFADPTRPSGGSEGR